jgi:hypothetical protein
MTTTREGLLAGGNTSPGSGLTSGVSKVNKNLEVREGRGEESRGGVT